MLDHVTGEVVRITGDAAIVSLGGVGLRISMPTGDLAGLRGRVTIHTYLHVREDDLQLFGFVSEHSRSVFKTLMTVNGVGAKVAIAILSHHSPEALERAITAGDHGAIKLVQGVGPKLAQRIVLELKDKLGAGGDAEVIAIGPLAEVRDGLKNLGYSAQEVQEALTDLPADGDTPTLMRFALKVLGNRETVS